MKTVIRLGEKSNTKLDLSKHDLAKMPLDSRAEVIQALIPLGLMMVEEELQREVTAWVGERYRHAGGSRSYYRWGKQGGSVYLLDQKVPVKYTRVRDVRKNQEVPLSIYQRLQEPRHADTGLMLKLLRGLSCRSYEACAETVPGVFGLSGSTVSRRFIKASVKALTQLGERDLSGYDFVALFMDGKCFAEDGIIIALGITMKGEKVILGFVQAGTENERVCGEFLERLVARGLCYEKGLLCVIDGSKGIRAAIRRAFGHYAMVQRCQWHKRENVVSYLPKSQQATVRKKLQRAYAEPTYEAAKGALCKIGQELRMMNRSAEASLEEGLEETLTLHRLGLFAALGTSFKTTNCIESLMAQVGQRTDKVDYWKHSDQKQRWVAAALLDIEPRLRKVKGYRSLPLLRSLLQAEIRKVETQNQKKVA